MFGVNLIEHGNLHSVGCLARVAAVTQRYSDGRMDVVIEGTHRHRIVHIHEPETQKGYVVADIETISDDTGLTDPSLLSDCAQLYNQIVGLVYGTSEAAIDPEHLSTERPSFFMAPKSGLSTEQKQQLLELTNENDRLELLKDHLTVIVPSIRKAEFVQRIVRSDGYHRALEE